jgi:hypothetical protein
MKNLINVLLILFLILVPGWAIAQKPLSYEGEFQSGYRDTKISFNVSQDGKQVSDLSFSGNLKCDSSIQQIKITTSKPLALTNGKVDGIVSDPEDGGPTAWHFEIHGFVLKGKATGTFRLHNTNLGCDTHKLKWSAALLEPPK